LACSILGVPYAPPSLSPIARPRSGWKSAVVSLLLPARGFGRSNLLGDAGRRPRRRETFEQAAIRELREETGLHVDAIGPEVESREFVLQLPDGEHVMADERFFVVQAEHTDLSRDGWTPEEHEVMADHRWWSIAELAQTSETVWPDNLPDILSRIEVLAPAGRTVPSNSVP
jgi:ADP-ribose pyrophosphatase YjhB (NUDIX family)